MPQRISALLLAAGSSTRMGQPKALLPLQGQPAICRCLTTLLQSSVQEIIVVLGPETEAAATILEDLPIKIIHNTLPRSEMATSVRLGIQAMNPDAVGALISLVDHPLVQPDTLRQLTDKASDRPEGIIIPTFQGRRGHPTVFPKNSLAEVYQGFNLREIIQRHADKTVYLAVEDEGVVMDMDTPEDYRKICRRLEEEIL
jgi:molybdenum cofactor cytidylyltransferase